MKLLSLYATVVIAALICYSCSNGRWECSRNAGQYMGTCTGPADTLTYFVRDYNGERAATQEYYEGLGYTCSDTLITFGDPYPLIGHYDKKTVKLLEKNGYECKSTGP